MRLSLVLCLGAGTLVLVIAGSPSNQSSPDDSRPRLVVTQVPAGSIDRSWSEGASLSSRYPSGSRIALIEPGAEGSQVVRVLSEGLDAAGAPDLSPLGDRVVFAGRSGPDSNWSIYETSLTHGRPALRSDITGDCGDPSYLPQREIVFVVTEEGDADPAFGPGPVSYLCTTSENGSSQRITFGPGAPTHPTVLHDGRVLFSMTTTPSTQDPAAEPALFTVNPDGTLLDPFAAVHDKSGPALRARQTGDGRIAFLSGPTSDSPRMVAWVQFAHPMGQRTSFVPTIADSRSEHPPLSLDVGSLSPAAEDDRLVVTGRAPSDPRAETFGAYLVTSQGGHAEKLYDDSEWDEVEAIAVVQRRRPLGRPSSVAAGERTGTLVCYDAAYSDGVYGPAEGAPAPAMVSVQTSMRAAAEAGLAREGLVEVDPGIVEIGRVALASDNSLFVRVPADAPLRVRSYDRDREPIATSGWFWIRPGETRACFGCHERRDTAPPNRTVRAIASAPHEFAVTRTDASE